MTGYVTGAYIVIEARENYWQKPQLTSKLAKANVQKLQIDFLSDKSMQMIALEKGTSCATKLAATDLPNFKAGGKYAGKYNIYSFDATDTFTIMPNLSEKSIFSDKNMRLAAFYALDSKGIVAALGGPELYKACTVSCSSATGDYSSDWDKIQSYQTIYDPKLAKEYLQKAGYKGQPVVILCEEHPTKKAIAVVAQGMLQAVGIKAEIRTYAMALMNSYLSNPDGWDLYMASGGHPTYAAARVLKSLGKTYGPVKGTPVNFSTDETFQTMLSAAVTKEGYGAKATTDIMKYVLDNAYDYACVYAKEITAYDKCFADFIYKKEGSKNNKIIFFACNFYLD
jgi:peptide/nickel transport system substrate-binding protein